METNKENDQRLKKTRIPLPIKPLPELPKHLVETKKRLITKESTVCEETNKRYPLKTLNTQPQLALPGPSNCIRTPVAITKPTNQVFDARHVTLRKIVEKLDWDYAVFEDVFAGKEVIPFSEEDEKKEEVTFLVENKIICHGAARTAPTQALKSSTLALEPIKLRKIKRSLKRPHSRELQGLSPVLEEPMEEEESFKTKLHFKEPIQERLMPPDFLKKSYMSCRDYASDVFDYLQGAEQRKVAPRISSAMRAGVLNWLMRVNGRDGNPAKIQTAIWYFDAVLYSGQVQIEKLQLIASACYWIAHKLHEKVLPASTLVEMSNDAFCTNELMAAERAVLEKLKFPPQPIIAQEYITYLCWCCDNEHTEEIELAATFLCIAGLMVDKSLCTEYPSVVGAGAVKIALLLLRKRDLMIKLRLCPVTAEKKAKNLSVICSKLSRAVRTMATPTYEYKTLCEYYDTPPHYIAQRVINAAKEINVTDTIIK